MFIREETYIDTVTTLPRILIGSKKGGQFIFSPAKETIEITKRRSTLEYRYNRLKACKTLSLPASILAKKVFKNVSKILAFF